MYDVINLLISGSLKQIYPKWCEEDLKHFRYRYQRNELGRLL